MNAISARENAAPTPVSATKPEPEIFDALEVEDSEAAPMSQWGLGSKSKLRDSPHSRTS